MNYEQAALAEIFAKFRGRHAADDGDVGLIVKYVGAEDSGTVEVTVTTGDITFKHGDLGSEVVDPTIDSGNPSDPGVIDVSETNSATMGKVVDLINASANWEAYLVDGLRADASTAGMLVTMAESQAKLADGLKLYKDTSAALNISLAIDNVCLDGCDSGSNSDVTHSVLKVISKNTFSTGTNLIQIYDVNRAAKTEEKIYEQAGAATTVEQALELIPARIDAAKGDLILVRMIGSAECTGYLTVLGRSVNFVNP